MLLRLDTRDCAEHPRLCDGPRKDVDGRRKMTMTSVDLPGRKVRVLLAEALFE